MYIFKEINIMCNDLDNLDKIYQYKISQICHICSNNACFTWKKVLWSTRVYTFSNY